MLNLRTGQHFGWNSTRLGDWAGDGDIQLPTTTQYHMIVAPAAVSSTGQVVNLTATLPVAPASLSLAGQSIGGSVTLPVIPAELSLIGQVLGGALTLPVTNAALSMAGQTVNLTYTPPGSGFFWNHPYAQYWQGMWRGLQ